MDLSVLFAFLAGLFFGSFFLVVSDRSVKNESFLSGRSHCDNCRRVLEWYELIPLLSFIFLKGKCRTCHSKLSFWYPISEILMGIIFAIIFLILKDVSILLLTLYIFLIASLFVIFITDLRYGIIPVQFIFSAFLSGIGILILNQSSILPHIISSIGAGGFFLTIFLLTRGKGMGFGDVLYSFLMGFILGFPGIIIGLYIAFLTGALLSFILVLLKKKKLHGDTIPFGPFLVLGTILVMLWGTTFESIAQQYFLFF